MLRFMSVSLAEVATRAGVSPSTVSRVLNGRPGVAVGTREAVFLAVELLGYELPPQLRKKTSGVVGLVVPELSNPIFPLFAQVTEEALVKHGYTQMLCSQHLGGVHEDEHVRRLLERGVSGIVFVSGIHAVADTDPQRYASLRERGVPIVFVNGYLSGVDAPFISNDDATSVELAVRHLAHLGHRRVGLAVGPHRYTTVRRKVDAFHDAVRRHLGHIDTEQAESLVASTVFSVEGGAMAAHELLDRGASGLVCASDLMALGAVRAVRGRGLRVPEDVSVVGSDDNPLLEFTDPPLTTVRQQVTLMGATAVRVLLDEIAGEPAPRAEFVFRPDLVVRGSTAPAPTPG